MLERIENGEIDTRFVISHHTKIVLNCPDVSSRAMEDLVESLTRGNVAEVKVLLASVALALGVYQLAVISVGYGKVRVPFLTAPPAFAAHRAVGDTARRCSPSSPSR